jgi:Curli production assembly/transport component CsgG.
MFRKLFIFSVIIFLLAFNGQAYCQTSFAILPMEVRGDVKPEKVEEALSSLYQVLINSKKYNIVDREHVKNVLSEQSFQVSGVTNKQDTVKLGKLLNVDKFIATSIYMKSADQFAINLRVVDVTTGQAEFYKEISTAKYSAKDHGRFCAAEIIAEYQLIGLIEGTIGDIIIVNLGEKHGLKVGDRLFVARKEVLISNTGEVLFQEFKRIGTLTVISMDSSRAKTKIKTLLNSSEKFIKSDIVSPEPLPKKETIISDVPLLSDVEKGKLLLDDDMENKKFLSVSNGQGESYKNGQLHINSLLRKSGHAYCFYPQPFTQLENIIFEGNIEFQETKSKYNKADVVIRSNKEYGDNAFGYSFFINNDGGYEVDLLIKGKNYPIIRLQSTPFLNRGAANNKFRIVAYDSKFDFYLNDNFIVGFEHELLEKGTIGFKALNGSYITVDNVKVWEAIKK